MLIQNRLLHLCSLLALACSTHSSAAARPIAFVQDGQLITYENQTRSTVTLRHDKLALDQQDHYISNYWGSLDDGLLLVTLRGDEARDTVEEHDHHCSTHAAGESAWILSPDGTLGRLLCTNVLRACPAPSGNLVALVSPERDLSIWTGDTCTTVTAPGKVSNAGWSPDSRYLVVSMFPPDWSQGAVSEASTTAEFLRLQNADLHLFDVTKMEFVSQLTNDPGTEYGPFFSLDGRSLYYVWLHLTEDQGGLMRLDLDKDDGTSASAAAVQLTNAGNDPGETPLGRVTTYIWRDAGQRLVFESGLPDGSGEIWTMSAAGELSVRLAAGRKPQPLGDSDVVFMTTDGTIETVTPEVQP